MTNVFNFIISFISLQLVHCNESFLPYFIKRVIKRKVKQIIWIHIIQYFLFKLLLSQKPRIFRLIKIEFFRLHSSIWESIRNYSIKKMFFFSSGFGIRCEGFLSIQQRNWKNGKTLIKDELITYKRCLYWDKSSSDLSNFRAQGQSH